MKSVGQTENVFVAIYCFSSFTHVCTLVQYVHSIHRSLNYLYFHSLCECTLTYLCARVMDNDARAGTKLSAPRDITAVT